MTLIAGAVQQRMHIPRGASNYQMREPSLIVGLTCHIDNARIPNQEKLQGDTHDYTPTSCRIRARRPRHSPLRNRHGACRDDVENLAPVSRRHHRQGRFPRPAGARLCRRDREALGRRAERRGIITANEAAVDLLDAAEKGSVAIVFGREDKGLPNEALDLAHRVVTIPTTNYASLNLAQAVLIALYELHLKADDATRKLAPPSKLTDPPTSERLEMLFADAYRALEAIAFFKTRNQEHVMRSLRSIIYRAQIDGRETDFLRAMSIEVLRTIDRERRSAGKQ